MILPEKDRDAKIIDDHQQRCLAECDGVLVYWGRAGKEWFKENCNDLRAADQARQVGKPILSRRIELILKGSKAHDTPRTSVPGQTVVTYGNVRLQRDVNRAFWKDVQIDLTLTEFQMVDYLASRAGRDVRYRDLYDIVHGEGFAAGQGEIGFRANVRAFIKRIRQKFRDVDSEFAQIENYPGFGYRWSDGDGT